MPYQRPKLNDPAHEGVRLQPGRDGRVRYSVWLCLDRCIEVTSPKWVQSFARSKILKSITDVIEKSGDHPFLSERKNPVKIPSVMLEMEFKTVRFLSIANPVAHISRQIIAKTGLIKKA